MGWLKTHADELWTEWAYFGVDSYAARNKLIYAAECIRGQYWDSAADALLECSDLWGYATGHIVASPPWGYGCRYMQRDIFYWVEDNWPTNGDEYELTATKICEAWAKDGFHDRALTIAFIDRMRQLVWNEPFYVKWAAKPTI